MMKKAGIQVHTELEDAASFEEFHEAFKLSLTPSIREAMEVLPHGNSPRATRRAHAV